MDNGLLETLNGRTVLVTGAGGSIATTLCKQLALLPIKHLKMLNVSETALYNLKKVLDKVPTKAKLEYVLGNVGDEGLLREHLPWSDVVIHTAAHKHIPLCEENIVQAVLNNVMGTRNLLVMAARHGVEQFVFVSTDKAVHPTSVMGMTKRIGELLTIYRSAGVCASVVRFGNVKDTSGSVLPLWREQIEAGRPITLTHSECTRFMMSVDDACELILSALGLYKRGLYVFDMGKPLRMMDLAEQLMDEMDRSVPIVITGLRPGEKIHEELTYGEELDPTDHPRIMQVREENGAVVRLAKVNELIDAALARQTARTLKILQEITK
jgi:FlaA1/EpsC-like NDP-sugar epimerase